MKKELVRKIYYPQFLESINDTAINQLTAVNWGNVNGQSAKYSNQYIKNT